MKENAKLESFHNTVKKQNTLPRLLKCKFVSAEVWLLLFFKPFYLFICLIDSWCAVLQPVLKAYMTLMKESLSDLASCYRKHMDCCELDKPGTGEFSSMRGTLFSFNHSSCLGGYCGILSPRHIHSKVCRCKYEWIISYYQLMYASLSLNLSSSWIMDTWYVQCFSLSKNKQKKVFGTAKKHVLLESKLFRGNGKFSTCQPCPSPSTLVWTAPHSAVSPHGSFAIHLHEHEHCNLQLHPSGHFYRLITPSFHL